MAEPIKQADVEDAQCGGKIRKSSIKNLRCPVSTVCAGRTVKEGE